MKVITANFVTCAVKECKTSAASFPLHFHDAELEMQELDFQPEFIRNVIPRIDWEALRVTANEVFSLPAELSHFCLQANQSPSWGFLAFPSQSRRERHLEMNKP